MANTINKDTLDLIKEFEGRRLEAYPDPGTVNDPIKKGEPWTIGYGHTGRMSPPDVNPGDKITVAQADEYLLNDLNYTAERLRRLLKVELNDNQFGALLSFMFNVGEGTFKKSSVLTNVNSNNFGRVPGRLALYRLANGQVMNGLVRRRAAEGNLWLKVDTKIEVKEEVKQTTGVTVTADQPTKKGVDVGAIGSLLTLLAASSDQVKKLIGNITSTFGIEPVWLLIGVGVGFAGFTIYNKFFKKEV